jgi:hypothetical protein
MATDEKIEEKELTIDEKIEKFYIESIEAIEKYRGKSWYAYYLRKSILGKYGEHENLVDWASLLENPARSKALSTLRNLKIELGDVITEVTGYRD